MPKLARLAFVAPFALSCLAAAGPLGCTAEAQGDEAESSEESLTGKCEAPTQVAPGRPQVYFAPFDRPEDEVLCLLDTALGRIADAEFFQPIPSIYRRIKTLQDVGLGYVTLGQQATTLSGGEAQRVKLAEELSKKDTGRTIYILDEPTTGLHFEDIRQLLAVLNKLVEKGNTVIVIEHNLDVIKMADYIVDIGPEGGHRGGTIVCAGTPEEVAREKKSWTGQFLMGELDLA